MVEFTLPKNSKITEGKTWPRTQHATHVSEFRIYRWNPDDGQNPSVDTYYVDRDDCGPTYVLAHYHRARQRLCTNSNF